MLQLRENLVDCLVTTVTVAVTTDEMQPRNINGIPLGILQHHD